MIIETKVHFSTGRAGRKRLQSGTKLELEAPRQKIPRISRLMALAIHFDGLIRGRIVRDYADLARLGGVSRARITQLMNLLNLAPEIQERLLYLQGASVGRDAITERELRKVCERGNWAEQKRLSKNDSKKNLAEGTLPAQTSPSPK